MSRGSWATRFDGAGALHQRTGTLNAELTADISLPDDLRMARECAPCELDGAVLLTGATGFLGRQLLHELLATTSATVYCLVRAAGSGEDGRRRLRESYVSTGLAPLSQAEEGRIVPVLGDLGAPRLGLEPAAFERLADTLDVVIHNGAMVHFLYPYRLLRGANVLGTREVLRLATHRRRKWLHFVSSTAIFRGSGAFDAVTSAREQSDIGPLGPSLAQGYALSKWGAEMLLCAARREGALVNIFRLGYISGNSATGVSSTNDARTLFLKACAALGAAPALDRLMDMAPVDFVSRALITLAPRQKAPGRNLHLFNHRSPRWLQVVDALSALGRQIITIPYEDWRKRLDVAGEGSNVWLRLFRELGTHDWLVKQLEVDCQVANAGLAEAGLRWPDVDAALLRQYLGYYARMKAI